MLKKIIFIAMAVIILAALMLAVEQEWTAGVPVETDATNFEWSAGAPYVVTEESEEVAAGAVYLASAEAAYITGQTLHINGGMAMV